MGIGAGLTVALSVVVATGAGAIVTAPVTPVAVDAVSAVVAAVAAVAAVAVIILALIRTSL